MDSIGKLSEVLSTLPPSKSVANHLPQRVVSPGAAAFFAAILGAAFLSGAVAQTTQPTLVPTPKLKTETLPAVPGAAQQNTSTHPLTADDLNTWLDGYMPGALRTRLSKAVPWDRSTRCSS